MSQTAPIIPRLLVTKQACGSLVGGRNRRCAEAFAKNGGKRSFDELEAEMLQGQKLQVATFIHSRLFSSPVPKLWFWKRLQGVSTAKEVHEVLSHRGWLENFPLFSTVHEISCGRLPPNAIVVYSELAPDQSRGESRIWLWNRLKNKQFSAFSFIRMLCQTLSITHTICLCLFYSTFTNFFKTENENYD